MTGDGSPSAGWWRSGNGEWYPPDLLPEGWSLGPDGVPRSFDVASMMPVVSAPSPWALLADGYRSWPVWAKPAPPIAAFILAGVAAAVLVLGPGDKDLDSVVSTGASAGNTTSLSTTVSTPPEPVSVDGLVISAPPTVVATSVPTTASAAVVSATTSTTRANAVAAPTSTVPPPTTVPPTISATTTGSTTRSTTTVPTITTTTAPSITTTTTRPTTTSAPVTYTVTGTLLVDSWMSVSDACGGSGRFAPFHDDQKIVLTDSSGLVVGRGALTGCRWTDWRSVSGSVTAKPEFSFTMSGVTEASSYAPRVAWKTWPAVALNTLRTAGWNIDLDVQ